jgi:two-component system chemotaxis response regulator CheY
MSDAAAVTRRTKVLVVDDDPAVRNVVSKHLQRLGFDIAVAEDGQVALRMVEKSKPDVMVLDIIMPSKDGLETIRELQRTYPDIRIIAASGGGGLGNDLCLKTARLLGAQRVLEKPFSGAALAAAIVELMLNERPGAAKAR